MTTQQTVNKRQTSVNKRQSSVNDYQMGTNDDQANINEEQNVINESTKIDLSVRNFWAIIVLAVTVTIATTSGYLFNTLTVASDIKEIKRDITYIRESLQDHYKQADIRDGEILSLNNRLITLETLQGIKTSDKSATLK